MRSLRITIWTLGVSAAAIGMMLLGKAAMWYAYGGPGEHLDSISTSLARALTIFGSWPEFFGIATGLLRDADKNAWPLVWGNVVVWAIIGLMLGVLSEIRARGIKSFISSARLLLLFLAAFVLLVFGYRFLAFSPAYTFRPGWYAFVVLVIPMTPVALLVASFIHALIKRRRLPLTCPEPSRRTGP